MKISPLPLLLGLIALPVVTASAQLIGYTNGSQVNILNAYNATMTVSGTDAGSTLTGDQLRFFSDGGELSRYTTSNPAATLDFGTTRTVKTISSVNWLNYSFTAATVETSNDGTNWTTYSGGLTVNNTATGPSNGGTYTQVTLNSSVNARYVRLTPTTFQNGNSGTDFRWYINTVRAFGDTGALAGDTNLSIIQNGAFSQTQSLTPIGSIGDINSAAILAPATTPYPPRTILYSIGNGEGFQLDLGQTFAVNKATMELYHMSTAPLTLTLSGSTDGTNFSQLYTTTWTPTSTGDDFLNFSFLAGNARYLDVTFASADTDIRVTEFAFFQSVPEPSTVALAALGVSAVLFRLRRKVRGE